MSISEPQAAVRTLTVDVVSDVVCPWCYIGKRRLESALRTLAARDARMTFILRWHPFQLNPDLPAAGVPRRSYLEAKFGGSERTAQIYERVRAAGASAGIPFAFEAILRQPNTLDAHRLIAWAQGRETAAVVDALVERLFSAFFLEGRDIGDRRELAALAGEVGIDSAASAALLESNRLAAEIAEANERANSLGISGVPFFIFDGKAAVSGAQEPDVLLDVIATAQAR